MFGFRRDEPADMPPYVPVSLCEGTDELQKRVNILTDDEIHVYRWLREYYTERWIEETLFITRAQLKDRIRMLCRKLGVPNVRVMLRIYGRLEPPSGRNAVVSTEEIDAYVEARSEREIQNELHKMRER